MATSTMISAQDVRVSNKIDVFLPESVTRVINSPEARRGIIRKSQCLPPSAPISLSNHLSITEHSEGNDIGLELQQIKLGLIMPPSS